MDKLLSGIIKSGSTSILKPKPWQVGQAPNGELKEKSLGSISGSEIPQTGHANLEEKIFSSFESTKTIFTSPSLYFKASSIDSVNLFFISSFKTILSITISMSCFLFLSISISSSRV